MEKCCRTCKWYNNQLCTCKDLHKDLNIMVENENLEEFLDKMDGILSEDTIEKLGEFKTVLEVNEEFMCKFWD